MSSLDANNDPTDTSNLPPLFPLRGAVAKYDYRLFNSNGKLADVWLQKQYQKLSLQPSTDSNSSRESRKRFRNGGELESEELYERDSTESADDMVISDTDSNSQVSGHGGNTIPTVSSGRENGLVHPPKRRLTKSTSMTDAAVTPIMSAVGSGNNNVVVPFTPDRHNHNSLAVHNVNYNNSIPASTIGSTNTSNISHQRPRTPNAINSPSHTPISDFEEEQPQQLPLPSPSASPVQDSYSEVAKLPTFDPIENQLMSVPTTQGELLDMMVNLSGYFNERNQNHLIFKLLQKVNRSSLSTLGALIQDNLRRDLISNLPLEISLKILSCLDHKTLLTLACVCKNWAKIINDTSIWVNLLKRDKLITDNKVIQEELANPEKLLEEWSDGTCDVNVAQVLYKKRCIIVNRWLDPKYEPIRRSVPVTGDGSKVVTCLQHDDDNIVTTVDDKTIFIYSTQTGKLLRELQGHEGGVWAMKYTGNTLVTGATDRSVRVWNIKTGKCTHIFRGHSSTIRCLDIMHPTVIGKDVNGDDIIFPHFPLIVTGSRDHNIHVWKLPSNSDDDQDIDKKPFDSNEIENPYLVAVLSGHTGSVRSVSAYGNIIISGSYDSTVRVWDLMDNGNCKHILTDHQDKVYSTALDFKTKTCFSGSLDSTIKVWNFETGKLLNTLEGHSSLVGLLDLTDGLLVSAAADASLRVWDPKSGKCFSKLEGHSTAITCFEHDGLRVVSGSQTLLKLWDAKKGKYARDLLTDVTGAIWQVRIDYKRCVAAVQRLRNEVESETFIEILDFSEPPKKRAQRIEEL
ncbi:F box protein, for ubiquitin dependent degradation [Scheffersomyces xylosifermentans]|uniref:F box protein, for ubiquitin dependent degradation n=1 Tax=Scheffersomyces xylosifermentans TaxID=1304137 RepID=UPI00315D215F